MSSAVPEDRPGSDVDTPGRGGAGEIDVSIVIPAYLGARTIADCLESVRRAAEGRRHEIIVVESSGDAAREIVRQRFPDVTLIQPDARLSAGAARNLGAAAARGRLVFFADQDCMVPLDWIERLARHLGDPAVGAAGGSVGVRNLSNLSGWGVYFLEFLYHFPGRGSPRRDQNFLVGCNSAYRAEARRLVDFPDQTLGEDVLISHRLRSRGFDVVYDPSIEVKHENREGWAEFFAYNRKMGRSAAAYHDVLRRWWTAPFFRVPALAFLAPAVILPLIGLNLMRSRWSYLGRFLLLSPMCLMGNLVWANAFRQEATRIRAQRREVMIR